MTLYHPLVVETKIMLENVGRWLDKAGEHAKAKNFDPEVLLQARLAPDQFPLLRQVQAACDAAKFAAARVSGKTPPSHPDTEKTLDEIRARIGTVTAYLDTFTAKDFEGAPNARVPLPFIPGGTKGANGPNYFVALAMPNFFFHVVHVYAILRHNGVPLGKPDFIGPGLEIIDL